MRDVGDTVHDYGSPAIPAPHRMLPSGALPPPHSGAMDHGSAPVHLTSTPSPHCPPSSALMNPPSTYHGSHITVQANPPPTPPATSQRAVLDPPIRYTLSFEKYTIHDELDFPPIRREFASSE